MAKETGLGAAYFLDGIDLSGDSSQFDRISKSLNLVELTGVDKFAIERKAGKLDGAINWVSFWNPSNAHLKLEDLPRTDIIGSYFHKSTLGVPVASLVAKQTNYDPTREESGALTAKVETLANAFWLDWGLALTAGKRTDTAATNGTAVDFNDWGGGSSFGLQAYLQVFAFTGTSVTIKLQGSSDNGADAYADITGGGFTVVSSFPLSERIATSRTLAIERYMRVVTTGTFSECQFAVGVTVNRTDMTI